MLRWIGLPRSCSEESSGGGASRFGPDSRPVRSGKRFLPRPYPTQVVYGVPGRGPRRGRRARCPMLERRFRRPGSRIFRTLRLPGAGLRRAGRGGRGRGREPYRGRPPRALPRRSRHTAPATRATATTLPPGAPAPPRTAIAISAASKRVRYGVRGRFVEGTFRNGTACSNSVFGDPVPGQPKLCQALN